MKSFFIICFTTLLITLAGPATADSNSGTITFRGAITNDSCNMDIAQNHVMFDCYDPARGTAVVTTANLMNLKYLTGLPVEVKMHWFNPEKTKGIIEVSYL